MLTQDQATGSCSFSNRTLQKTIGRMSLDCIQRTVCGLLVSLGSCYAPMLQICWRLLTLLKLVTKLMLKGATFLGLALAGSGSKGPTEGSVGLPDYCCALIT